jgi:hypothetical protein
VYTTDLKVFGIKTCHSFGGYCVTAERQYCRNFSVRVAPSRDAIYRIAKQFEETGSVCDKHAKAGKLSASVRTEEVVGAARGSNNESKKRCATFSTADWGLN